MQTSDLELMILHLMATDGTISSKRSSRPVLALPCIKREHTRVGYFANYEHVEVGRLFLAGIHLDWSNLSGIVSPGDISFGGVVYVVDGYIDCIELFVFESEPLPSQFDGVQLSLISAE